MSYYQPGTFGNIQLYRFLNQNFGAKVSPQTRASLMNSRVNTTAPFTFNHASPPRAASAAIGRMHVGNCCSSCSKGGPCGG